ncbi:hypothetical protein Bhyg_08904 [Pseudolycoriella hygida]|uniref:Uncharacterized protein n=1 Tax=Pseudolycoriella hygida TaxID=35572 RepID=A0A9Q0RUV9_9DIPT|nr:hypothetical protein Bhyg_17404 [Pseudolycoriella hygida]KAJ6643939.1 hypothetical protein Bhyg_08904 [Pseudolycoriella hygida]
MWPIISRPCSIATVLFTTTKQEHGRMKYKRKTHGSGVQVNHSY